MSRAQHLATWLIPGPHPWWLRYGVAALSVPIALIVTLLLEPHVGTRLLILFLAAVVLSALYGGLGPALMVTALGVLCIDYWLGGPSPAFGIATIEQALQLGVFLLVALATGWTGARLHAALAERDRELQVRRQAEERLADSNRRLATTLADLRRIQAQIVEQERLHAVGQMASGIAHDFNNVLAMILGYTELLLADPEALDDRERVRADLELINRAAQDASAVVARLREAYRVRPEAETFDRIEVNDLVAQAISFTQPRWRDEAQARGITIEIRTELGEVPPIRANAPGLREVLANLLFNAVDALPAGGTITVGTRIEGEQVVLTVADTGLGMSEDVRRQCLEPFFTTKGERGTGLGLSMVRDIIDRHGGTIDVRSAPNEGATFTIGLPIDSAEADVGRAGDQTAGAPRGQRILVVEDEPRLRRILTSYLEIDGHAVTAAANGVEALERFEPGRFDLVITDRAMPEMGGEALAAALDEREPDLPIVMLTGFGELMQAAEEQPPGVDLVLAKPTTMRSLREALSRLIPPDD